MKVSVIVPTHHKNIHTLEDSIEKSTHKDIEIVYVHLGLERSEQRNIGIKHSKGKYLLILDSDQSISPNLIKECVDIMHEGFSAVYIPEKIIAKSFFGKIRAFERTFYDGTAIDVPRFVRRDICPMFDESLTGPEDADWGNRIPGFKTISKNPLYHHDDISLWTYIRKKIYYSKSMRAYAKKWPDDPCINIFYRCFTVFVEKGKWKKLLAHPILSLGILFVLAIRGIIYATSR